MRHIKTLTEEITRIKSLFDDSRLYGNLSETIIISEQLGLKRNLSKSLSMGRILKVVSAKQLNDFLNFPVNSFDDLLKHFDNPDFMKIWKTILPEKVDFDFIKDLAKDLGSVETKGTLKKITQEDWNEIITGIPVEGGLREFFMDRRIVAQGRTPKKKTNVDIVVKKDTNSGKDIVAVKEEGGDIKTYMVDGDEMKEVSIKNKEAVDNLFGKTEEGLGTTTTDFLQSLKSDGKGGKSEGFSAKDISENAEGVPVNPNMSKEEFMKSIDQAVRKSLKKPLKKDKKQMTLEQLKQSKDGSTVVVYDGDGNIKYTVTKIEDWILTLDADGNIISRGKIGDVIVPATDKPLKSGDSATGTKSNLSSVDYSKIDKSVLGALRYLFPLSSTAVRSVRFVLDKSKIAPKGFSKERFTFAPGKWGDLTQLNTYLRFKENAVRIGVEQIALIYVYGTYKAIQRGEESPFSFFDGGSFSKKSIDYGFLVTDLLDSLKGAPKWVRSLFPSKEVSEQWCKNHCERKEGISPKDVDGSDCYRQCTTQQEELRKKMEAFAEEMKNFSETLTRIESLKSMDEKELQKFCSGGEGGEREKMLGSIDTLKKSISDVENKVKESYENQKYFGAVLNILKLSDETSLEKVLKTMFTPPGQSERITPEKLTNLKTIINDRCREFYEKQQGGDIPLNNQNQIETNSEDDDMDNNMDNDMDNRMVQLNISVIPIELIG